LRLNNQSLLSFDELPRALQRTFEPEDLEDFYNLLAIVLLLAAVLVFILGPIFDVSPSYGQYLVLLAIACALLAINYHQRAERAAREWERAQSMLPPPPEPQVTQPQQEQEPSKRRKK
jgi:magnesium-transporting ATPase (P-type)